MVNQFLSFLKDSDKRQTLLKKMVYDWLLEHEHELNHYDNRSFRTLRKLVVGGTVRNSEVFSPSNATRCMRSQVITKLLNKDISRNDPHLLNIFEDGYWRHIKWQMIFWRMGIVESMEQFVSSGKYDYGGSTDLILKIPKKGRVVVDIKGANASAWNEINSTGIAMKAHIVQVNIYMMLNGIDTGVLWYENKNTNEVCEVLVEPDASLLAKIRARQQYMKKHVKAKAFPKEECSLEDNDRTYMQCPNRLNCPKLPVHHIRGTRTVKVAEPRDPSKLRSYARYNRLTLTPLKGPAGARDQQSEKYRI